MSDLLSIGGYATIHPLACASKAYNELYNSNKFNDISKNGNIIIIILIVVSIMLWIMALIATNRMTNSGLQVVLCFFFGSIYVFFAWIYFGFTSHKLVKMSKV
jgi:hypothetical protein